MSNKTQNKRVNFATSKILEYPDLLEVQLKSFRDFFQLETTPESRRNEGLFQVFQETRKFSRSRTRGTTTNSASSIISSILPSIRSRNALRGASPTTSP